MNVEVTGSLGLDYIMNFPGRFADRIMPDKIHAISLSFLVDKLEKQFGGTAGNIAYTLKLLGIEPFIVSAVGNDFQLYEKHLKDHKISLDYLDRHKNVGTGAYFVVTDREDNQIGSFFVGASAYNKDLRLTGVKPKIDFVVLAPNEPSAMVNFVGECKKNHLRYLYDPAFQIGSFTPDQLRDGIEHAEIFIGNDYEIALVEQKLGLTHHELLTMVPLTITTLGNKGSIIETAKESLHIKPAKPKNVSDPTGAGDAYRAGFVAGYLRGFDLVTCGQMGSVAAVYTVEKYGTQTHHFTTGQFCRRYKENFGSTLKL